MPEDVRADIERRLDRYRYLVSKGWPRVPIEEIVTDAGPDQVIGGRP